ncbi:Hpt domain-containing protein [Ralstonia nicotianae]|nr:Hpt domain-containing protein [Ralstonia solanacearum]
MQPHPATATATAPAPRAAVHPAIADTLPAQIVIVLTELFGTDLRQWHFLIDLFCDTVMQDLADLEVAIARGAAADVATAAHRIAGSARMLGHGAIGDAAHAMERIALSDDNGRAHPADLQHAFVGLRMQIDTFRRHACRCAWPDAGAPG